MKKLRLKLYRKRQVGEALRLANAVYQEMRGEELDRQGEEKRELLRVGVSVLEIFCLSVNGNSTQRRGGTAKNAENTRKFLPRMGRDEGRMGQNAKTLMRET